MAQYILIFKDFFYNKTQADLADLFAERFLITARIARVKTSSKFSLVFAEHSRTN